MKFKNIKADEEIIDKSNKETCYVVEVDRVGKTFEIEYPDGSTFQIWSEDSSNFKKIKKTD